jgi:hypothetical protein
VVLTVVIELEGLTLNADSEPNVVSPLAIRLQPLTMVRNSARPSWRWLDWNASARAAAILASCSFLDFGGTDRASLSDFTARMRCCMACSAALVLDTASRCEAARARIECMRYSYC